MKPTTFDVHNEITNRIIAAIEQGAANFEMPWHGVGTMAAPVNAATKRAYRGVNILSLWVASQAHSYSLPQWATFKQWRNLGKPVRKGEKGTPVIFYKTLQIEDVAPQSDTASEEKTIPFARASWVFNSAGRGF